MPNSKNKTTNLSVVKNDKSQNIWTALRIEAATSTAEEPILASMLNATILNHTSLEDALAYHLAQKLGGNDMNSLLVREVFSQTYSKNPHLLDIILKDIEAVQERDPACQSYLQPFLYFKGFAALQSYRVAHALWLEGRQLMALYFQSRVSELFQVDIHPAAKIGGGIFIDHATGIVIGETAVIGDNVSILHNVTLGGTGKEGGDRHPKVGNGVLIGAGAKILGNIKIGDNARIAAGSLVLKPVNPWCTVAGIPAKVIGCAQPDCCAKTMDQVFDIATFDPGL